MANLSKKDAGFAAGLPHPALPAATEEEEPKPRECKFYNVGQVCRQGASCKFSHDDAARMRALEAAKPPKWAPAGAPPPALQRRRHPEDPRHASAARSRRVVA